MRKKDIFKKRSHHIYKPCYHDDTMIDLKQIEGLLTKVKNFGVSLISLFENCFFFYEK